LNGRKVSLGKAAAVAVPTILAILAVIFGLAFLLSGILGLPPILNLPVAFRAMGGAVVVVGLGVAGWTFSHRSPADMMVSTYVTFTKLFTRVPVSEMGSRTEPLVISGPQKYVRSPLYLGVVLMSLGWAIFTGAPYIFVATVLLLVWFCLILIPFEERELRALFGEQWRAYEGRTPMLMPFIKLRKRSIKQS
jgi:protein-S-isoprenylcysteine O-methyltransferase Ste14